MLNRLARPDEFLAGSNSTYRDPVPEVTADLLEGQHAIRAWEYSQALRALDRRYPRTQASPSPTLRFLDVGGAGSSFHEALKAWTAQPIVRVDPTLANPGYATEPNGTLVWNLRCTLEEYRQLNPGPADAVFCLSVIEHVADSIVFLDQLCDCVRPGGLLMLTCDAAETSRDLYHFHWMRRWIAGPAEIQGMLHQLLHRQFIPLDAPDLTWHGPTVYDYGVASLACVRKG
jgi:SAM-dependent methyltransferase